ncbi:MAG: bi-domain-containing oxidoreductase [Bacteroidetes bacterium]|nr:bi-domain-containing oxidoreductase [Bacteroidota bacterium]
MKQLIQNLRTGTTSLEEVPVPQAKRGHVLIQTTHSLVSLGTEKMLVEFGKASLIEKARQQPEKVQQVLDKIKAEGLMPTLEAVFNKLDQPIPLGYCNVGVVREVGEGVTEFAVGDRVASNGPHAEYVSLPKNLCARIPDNVTNEEAAFTVIGSIGLQGIRLIQPTFGEAIVVVGLGLIGLLTAQLLKAAGCRVMGFDVDQRKVAIARDLGIVAFDASITGTVNSVNERTNQIGADGVIVTASSPNDEIIHQAAQMCRKRGRIVLVGVVGLDLKRSDFYEKELTFQVSCSYGPGRYDEAYEQKGQDYPLPFVRWTAKRNFESVLQALADGALHVKPLISEIVPFDSFQQIYGNLGNKDRIASIFEYRIENQTLNRVVRFNHALQPEHAIKVALIGAGNFSKATLLPALKRNNISVYGIASHSGLSATLMAKKYGAAVATTNYLELLNDKDVNLAIITTRHSLHAQMVKEALRARKHVFVEKPLAINKPELDEVKQALTQADNRLLHVGYNRRFSPHVIKIKSMLGDRPGLMNLVLTMNAGALPPGHWTLDPKEGGRIIGEACHLVDLAVYLTGSVVRHVTAQSMGEQSNSNTDSGSFLLRMENGSNVVVNYFANGAKAYSKERIEVFYQGKTAVIDNFIKTTGFGWKNFSSLKTALDKGHSMQVKLLSAALRDGKPLIPINEIINVSEATLAMVRSLQENNGIDLAQTN